jgi:hypothetical protein
MLFLVGSQRSGTHWLQRILATHPDVANIPSETQLFTYALSRVAEVVHHGVLSSPSTGGIYMDPDAFSDATRDYCDAIFGNLVATLHGTGHRYVLERSPNHVFHLQLIARVYPDASVVHMIRDGRDVARSQVAQTYGASTIEEAARDWRRAIETARATAPSFQNYVEVRYEHLLGDATGVVRDLFEQLGLVHDPALVEAAVAEAQIPANVDASDTRVGRGKWQQTWSRADVATFLAEIGPLAAEFGIEVEDPDSPRSPNRRPARRRLRKPSRTPSAPPESAAELIRRATRVVDGFLSALAIGDARLLTERSAPTIDARVVQGSLDRRAIGAAAIDLLIDVARDDAVGWAHQVRGDVHGGSPTFTTVLTHRHDDGRLVDRVLVLRPRGDVIDKVTYYRMPLAPPQFDSAPDSHG